jgi:UDP-N-acetylmuramoyl-tripeptide--D-alanyl-D-alanine ligase
MKKIFKNLLRIYLKYLTKLVLLIHRPIIIAVAGSTNKHFIKKEIKRVLIKKGLSVRANPKNFNTEIGLPLAVLDLPSGYNSYKRWFPIIFLAIKKVFQKNFPEFLVLSLGSSDPGDMKYLLTIVKPRVVIISDITQRYLEGFNGLNSLLREYEHISKKLKIGDYLIINNDNPRVATLREVTRAEVISFGFLDGCDCQAEIISQDKFGQKVKMKYHKEEERFINKYGRHHVAAEMVGLIVEI